MDDIAEGRLWNLKITVITNSLASTDEPWVHAGYQRYRTEMLDLGVHLYEVAPSRIQRSKSLGTFGQSIGRFHGKAAAIDGERMFIGSLNFDPRSEKHNTELGLLIQSPELTAQLLKLAALVVNEAAYKVSSRPRSEGPRVAYPHRRRRAGLHRRARHDLVAADDAAPGRAVHSRGSAMNIPAPATPFDQEFGLVADMIRLHAAARPAPPGAASMRGARSTTASSTR